MMVRATILVPSQNARELRCCGTKRRREREQRCKRAGGAPMRSDSNGRSRWTVMGNIRRRTFRRFEIESEVLMSFIATGQSVEFVPIRVIYHDERTKIRPLRDTLRWFWWWGRRRI